MASKSLSLDPIVRVIVNLSARAAARRAFNLGLIIGSSTIIPKTERIRFYTDVESMLEDGFANDSAEYKAALLYFSQEKTPTRLAVGVKDTDETYLEAVQACRDADGEWWCFTALGTVAADIEAIAAYTEAASPSSYYLYTVNDPGIISDAAGNIFHTLKGKNYRRSLGQYSTDNPNAVVAAMGYAMGANSGTRNSAFTLKFKTQVGVATEALTNTQVERIFANYGNVYINRGTYYDVFERGTSAANIPFDEILNLDKLANDIQLNIMDVLYKYPKVPQTESGLTIIVNTIVEACEQGRRIGFVAPGVWKGQDILELTYGDTLPNGYLIQPDSLAEQPQADREARIAPPIYVAIKLAGAIEFVVVQIDVNR